MRLTSVLLNRKRSLAFSVYFKQPELGMRDYEILSRATAFLIGIDPPDVSKEKTSSPYQRHLELATRQRELKEYKRKHKVSPAGGPERDIMDLSWLEFVPREVRPTVHVVTSSHVAAPFLWKDYYPQDWLNVVRPEHCKYTLEVYEEMDGDVEKLNAGIVTPRTPLARVALNTSSDPFDYRPFHHPEGRDIALLHIQEEEAALNILERCGVDILYFRDTSKWFEKEEQVRFEGYMVLEPTTDTDGKPTTQEVRSVYSRDTSDDEDNRIFFPCNEAGTISFRTENRFFAKTELPLPEGLCGAPVLDKENAVCGIVEGIIPLNHKNPELAGMASFLPHTTLIQFIDYVERNLVEQMMPPDLFKMVVAAKKTNAVCGATTKVAPTGEVLEADLDEAYEIALENLRRRCSEEQYEKILEDVHRQTKEVSKILEMEGGSLDDIINRVLMKSIETQVFAVSQMKDGNPANSDDKEERTATK